jgi:uncharacterized protein YndB with AHSA1/START domain
MNTRKPYQPGSAAGTRVDKQGDRWALIVVRELRHAPPVVWDALTDPAQLAEWAPFDASRNLASTGPVQLSTVGAPHAPTESTVTLAVAPSLLQYSWGGNELRWELEAIRGGTRLTLWHNIDKHFVSWGAAGWHICFDVLEHLLGNDPLGRMAGPDVAQFDGWQRLQREYAELFG